MTSHSTPPLPKNTKKFLQRLGQGSKKPKLRVLNGSQGTFSRDGSSLFRRTLLTCFLLFGLVALSILLVGCEPEGRALQVQKGRASDV